MKKEQIEKMQNGRKNARTLEQSLEYAQKLCTEGIITLLELKEIKTMSIYTPSKINYFISCFESTKNKTDAIKCKCLQCCGYYEGEVRECKVYNCALYKFRPYKNDKKENNNV